jgi:hypothetical protein
MFVRLPHFFCGIAANLSAAKARRKWPYGRWHGRKAAMVTVAAAIIAIGGAPGAGARVPLPKPRPPQAPAAKGEAPMGGTPVEADKPAEVPVAPSAQPSTCRLALTEAIAIAPSIPDIHGRGGCGGHDLVRLEAVVLPDNHQVAVRPEAILRCEMATAVANWIRTDVNALASKLGSNISELDNFDSYECRGRNRVAGAQLSEHGRANALDIRSLKLANGRVISLTDRNVPRDLREAVLHSACTRFATVLGPGSDGFHEDHIHLDLMDRRNDYRICQWDVWDPLPQKAPMLPEKRPEQAPPREIAAKPGGESDVDKPAAEEDSAASAAAEKPTAEKRSTKKRR